MKSYISDVPQINLPLKDFLTFAEIHWKPQLRHTDVCIWGLQNILK